MRTLLIRLAGVFLFVYGLSAILMGWWAYSVTHEAFTSVRNFSAIFDRERGRALDALQGATGILGGRDEANASSGAPRIVQRAEGLADRLRGLLGGVTGGQSSGTPAAGAAQSAGESLGLLDDLAAKLGQARTSWTSLGEGPFRKGLLDQVEFAVNAVLVWMVAHGVASVIIGLIMLVKNTNPTPAPVIWAGQPPPGPYVQPAPPYGGHGAPAPPGWPPAGRPGDPPTWTGR